MKFKVSKFKFGKVARRLISFLVSFFLFFVPVFAAEKYVFDEAHSIPQFEFSHLGVTTQTGRFDVAKGVINIDFSKRRGSVYYEIDASSLNMGYGTETSESAGYRLFNVSTFPTITFKSGKLIFDSKNEITGAVGKLTLLGVSKPLTVSVNNFKCATNPINRRKTCACDVRATLMRSDFGMIQYIPGISDLIVINVPVEAYKN